jgi:beta-lactam-binding protein with PASTA domain
VGLVISQGPHYVNVPNVFGQSVGAATEALSAAGLSVSGVQGNPIATVAATSPAAGQQVLYGSAVVLITR